MKVRNPASDWLEGRPSTASTSYIKARFPCGYGPAELPVLQGPACRNRNRSPGACPGSPNFHTPMTPLPPQSLGSQEKLAFFLRQTLQVFFQVLNGKANSKVLSSLAGPRLRLQGGKGGQTGPEEEGAWVGAARSRLPRTAWELRSATKGSGQGTLRTVSNNSS